MGYFPVLYTAFSRREVSISLLDARAGSPPTAAELLKRHSYEGGETALSLLLVEWERWSAELLESHISYPLLCYFRSQHSNQSWISALDGGAGYLGAADCRRAGARGAPGAVDLCHGPPRAGRPVADILASSGQRRPDRLPRARYDQLYDLLCQSGVSVCRDGGSYERLARHARALRRLRRRR
jgi:hypothetical protein